MAEGHAGPACDQATARGADYMVPVGGYLAWVVVRGEANRWRFDLGRHGSEREAWAVCERHAAALCSERGAELVPAVKRQQRGTAAAEPAGVLRADS